MENAKLQIEAILQPQFQRVIVQHYKSVSICIFVIDPQFANRSRVERVQTVEALLAPLPASIQQQIASLSVLTPDEFFEQEKKTLVASYPGSKLPDTAQNPEFKPELQVVLAPSVYLIGQSGHNPTEIEKFLADQQVSNWTTDAPSSGERLVEIAGRLCYMSFAKPRPGGNKAYIEHILEVGHGSVLEHAVFTFLVTGVSRALTHELVRHRAGFGYSQLSQRFVDESDCAFVLPPILCNQPAMHPAWRQAVQQAQQNYQALVQQLVSTIPAATKPEDQTLRRKRAREAARSVLPNCTETKITVTGNARAWRHFIEMRGDTAADLEIRRLANAIWAVLAEVAPNMFGDYDLIPDAWDIPALKSAHPKV